jgi:hypothetical protein
MGLLDPDSYYFIKDSKKFKKKNFKEGTGSGLGRIRNKLTSQIRIRNSGLGNRGSGLIINIYGSGTLLRRVVLKILSLLYRISNS